LPTSLIVAAGFSPALSGWATLDFLGFSVFFGIRQYLEIYHKRPNLSENTARKPFWHTLKGLGFSLRRL
jgi:hypothetical protein